MVYRGHIEKGAIVLDEPAQLPEGAQVRVEVCTALEDEPMHPDLVRFTGILPRDLDARDEYVAGMRKKHS